MANSKAYAKQCEVCGIDFMGRKDQRFCCRKHQEISKRKRNQKNKARAGCLVTADDYPALYGIKRNDRLVKNAMRAKEFGLSYGMYMAYKSRGILEEVSRCTHAC